MLTATTTAAREMAEAMDRIAASDDLLAMLNRHLPNKGKPFEEISRKGLASVRQDRTIFTAGLNRDGLKSE